jgi:two-component system OmpR family response regulator
VRVLVIEDDGETARYLVKGLTESGYVVDHAEDGPHGLSMAASEPYDVLVVDRMLPGLDGLAVIEALRKSGNDTPALILSARARVDDRVAGLRCG